MRRCLQKHSNKKEPAQRNYSISPTGRASRLHGKRPNEEEREMEFSVPARVDAPRMSAPGPPGTQARLNDMFAPRDRWGQFICTGHGGPFFGLAARW